MRLHGLGRAVLVAAMVGTAGCATQFSPQWGRREIQRQTGAAPGDSFEFKLEGATMALAQAVVSRAAGESIGLSRIHLAIYDLPAGGHVDLDRMRIKGWDKVVRAREGGFGLLVLVRTKGSTLADLVVFAQGENQLLYGRQKGRLDSSLPSAIQRTLRTAGLQGLKEQFLSSTRTD